MSTQSNFLKPSDGFEYYTNTIYWNNFDATNFHLNRLISGDHLTGWIPHTLNRYGPFEKAYFLNCGNGWVEREFYTRGGVSSVFGSDISKRLLEQAKVEARKIGMPAEYMVSDANHPHLPEIKFDCVVNHAALHHVAFIDCMTRDLCQVCAEDGYLVCYDYIGPHRNQYPWEMWSKVVEVWHHLPPALRTELQYPHLRTMLVVDPTEAVHSELIVSTIARYFDVVEERALGGAIAYPLLYQNRGLHEAVSRGEDGGWLQRIIEADVAYTQGQITRSLFAYMIAKPKKAALKDSNLLQKWSEEEERREAEAIVNGGRYHPVTALEIIYEQKRT